jgi:hypothetical protein
VSKVRIFVFVFCFIAGLEVEDMRIEIGVGFVGEYFFAFVIRL